MPAHQPILPAKAVELVEARNLSGAAALLADFAAAGLIKTYALLREVRPTECPTEIIRDSQIPSEDWERIIASGNIQTALNGGTVRLEGSPLQGGTPMVLITGISFSEASLAKVLDRYCANSPASITKQSSECKVPAKTKRSTSSNAPEERPIKPGALTVSVDQAQQATGLGRTKISELMKEGTLQRTKVGRRTLISVESIERLIGTKVSN